MRKVILAAGIVRDILFFTSDDADLYLYKLQHDGSPYKLIERFNRDDGSVILRVLGQYNNADLITLFQEDE